MQEKVVLQYRRLAGQVVNCITIQHCIVRQWAGEKALSRYNYCIVTEAKGGVGHWLGRRWARAERAGERAWARRRALQTAGRAGPQAQRARGRAEQAAAGARGALQAGRRRGAQARGAGRRRGARGAGAGRGARGR